ncbi:MAG: hypothetical protein HC905_02905 [Bacteroidales bacterium]|nr:hypothetical protein [Bacteroidales bacterium]
MENNYPTQNEIKIEWKKIHSTILILVTVIVIGYLTYEIMYKTVSLTKYLTVAGLYIDIIGVIIASLKTPYYGSFMDGGKIEILRQKVENKSFKKGMYLIAIGMVFQMTGTLLQ